MTLQKIRILTTTTAGGQRYARGDEITLGDRQARDLIAIGKAELLKEKQASKKLGSILSPAEKTGHET